MKIYNKKAVISGDIVEIFEYENYISEGYQVDKNKISNCLGRSSEATEENKEVNRVKVLQRARTSLMRLINSNIGRYGYNTPKFITLTFKENVTDIKKSNYEFKKFRQRLEYKYNFKLKYTCVIEFQKRGAIHYHLVMFNAPYIPNNILREIWKNGFVKINKINHVDNVGAYVCKYMSKDNNDSRLRGEKCYFSSRGLIKPMEIKDEKEIEKLQLSLPQQTKKYSSSFTNDYIGEIKYSQYNLSYVDVEVSEEQLISKDFRDNLSRFILKI